MRTYSVASCDWLTDSVRQVLLDPFGIEPVLANEFARYSEYRDAVEVFAYEIVIVIDIDDSNRRGAFPKEGGELGHKLFAQAATGPRINDPFVHAANTCPRSSLTRAAPAVRRCGS